MEKFGLSLKGGMARGFGSIGVLRFFQEENLKPEVIAGSSAGAMVAAMYSLGLTWEEMLHIFQGFKFRNIISLKSLYKEGAIVSSSKLRHKLLTGVPSKIKSDIRLEELPIKTVFFATAPRTLERVVIDKGRVLDAAIASSAYPIVFPNSYVNHKLLIDGDLTSSFSTTVLKNYGAKKIIGVATRRDHIFAKKMGSNILNKGFDVWRIISSRAAMLADEMDPPHLTLEYNAQGYGYFNFKGIEELAERAYKHTRRNQKEIFDLLKV